MKKITLVLSLVLILALAQATAFAQTTDTISVRIDSVGVEFTEDTGMPFVDENGRTLVPFRKALEAYGANVEWDNDNRIATAVKDDITVEVPIDQDYIIVNGEQKANDTAAKIVNSKTYLPIRAVVEAFGSSVEWDQNLKTVVITTEPIDAETILKEATNKSYDWKNYDADILVNMSIPVADDAGSVQTVDMDMKMYMTIFMDPALKAKINSSIVMNVMDQEITQPVMDMYLASDDTSFTTYIGTKGEDGSTTWMKSAYEDEMFSDLLKYNAETLKANKELSEKYTKDIKYFGKYEDESGKSMLRMQYTLSNEIFKDIFGEYIDEMSASENEQDILTAEMIKGLADGGIGDLVYIVYIDEESGEIVKYEADLGSLVLSMMDNMTAMMGEVPQSELEMLKQMKATMQMEIKNINEAEDFEIPEEALNATDISEMMQELEDQIEAEAETDVETETTESEEDTIQ